MPVDTLWYLDRDIPTEDANILAAAVEDYLREETAGLNLPDPDEETVRSIPDDAPAIRTRLACRQRLDSGFERGLCPRNRTWGEAAERAEGPRSVGGGPTPPSGVLRRARRWGAR